MEEINSKSPTVIYDDSRSPFPEEHFEYRLQHEFPVPPHVPEFRYFYSNPDIPFGMENFREQVYSIKNNSIDTIIFIRPGEHLNIDEREGVEWSVEKLENQLREIEIQNEFFNRQLDQPELYVNQPVHPPEAQWNEYTPDHRVASAEKIIRQELRDDGLTVRGRKYVIELDSKAMYINGEKQPREVYRKYRKLVESLESIVLDGNEFFRLIF